MMSVRRLGAEEGLEIRAVFSELQAVIIDELKTRTSFESILESLQITVHSMKAMFDDIETASVVLNCPERETAMFIDKMKEGKQLILKSSRVKRWNLYKKHVYSKKLREFDESLMRFFQINVQAAQSMLIGELMLAVNTGAGD